MTGKTLNLFIIAGEESGDRLAAGLVTSLRDRFAQVPLAGVGGDNLKALGMEPMFEMEEISIIGLAGVIVSLPKLIRRIAQAADAAVAARPDAVILVDAPDFNLRVARKIRERDPSIPIIKWVSPSVWAWRPGRARAMKPYIDHLLALLPFEPQVHEDLGGPPCTYTGHPLLWELDTLRPGPGERVPLEQADKPKLVVMPGSRRGEIKAHGEVFGEALGYAAARGLECDVCVPTLPRIEEQVRACVARWPVPARVVVGQEARRAELRSAHAGLVASGTATLEVALAGVPFVVGYRVDRLVMAISSIIRVPSVVLPNIILGRNAIREYLGVMFRPEVLGAGVDMFARDTPERRALVESLAEIDARMGTGGRDPSQIAADAVLATIAAKAEERG